MEAENALAVVLLPDDDDDAMVVGRPAGHSDSGCIRQFEFTYNTKPESNELRWIVEQEHPSVSQTKNY